MDMWILWLVVVILLTIIELSTVNLVSVWFIASAIVSLLISLFNDSFYLCFGVFVALGVLLMVITRPLLLKKLVPKEEKTNIDRVIGMEGIVTQDIKKNIVGEVKVDGKFWSAISEQSIKAGTTVIVEAIDSVKLIVRKGEE